MDPLIVGAIVVVVGYAAVYLVDRKWGKTLFDSDRSEREKMLVARLTEMETTVKVLSSQLNEKAEAEAQQRANSRERDALIKVMEGKISACAERMDKARAEITALKHQLEEENVIKKSPDIIVLGIWPDNPQGLPKLDQQGEASAIYQAGFTYVSLLGPAANPDGIVWELDRVMPNVLEIGAHDDEKGNIVLSNGPSDPGWWGELLEGKQILLAVLLYCRSNMQDRMNISDVMLRSGVEAVVSFDRAVEDVQAVHFARMLYAKLAEGKSVQQAVQRAKLVVDRQTRDMVRLRTRT